MPVVNDVLTPGVTEVLAVLPPVSPLFLVTADVLAGSETSDVFAVVEPAPTEAFIVSPEAAPFSVPAVPSVVAGALEMISVVATASVEPSVAFGQS